MPDIFLSYSREDQPTARRYAEALQREGFSVWWDQALNPGEDFDQVTERALEEAKAVIVLWSKASVSSRWVRAEATHASTNNRLVPVMIEPCKRPIMFELKHTADLSQWQGNADDPGWRSFIASTRRFTGAEAMESSGSQAVAANAVAGKPRRLGRGALAVAFAVLLLAGVAGWWFATRGRSESSGVAGAAPATHVPVTLAVLPFVNLSSDPEQEYFSDGLTEEILNQLSQVKDLRVTARTSSFAFKGRNEDLREIGRKLGVARILEGSVRRSGQQLAITVQLINAEDDTHIWSQTYERELKDVFAIQEEIAKAVTGALSVTLDVGAMARARGGTTNLEAYDRYLRGRAQNRQNKPIEATPYYREATVLDPSFISAWSALHASLAASLVSHRSVPIDSVHNEMAQISARVMTLAPQSWQAQSMLATELMDQHRWSEAEAALDRARSAGATLGTAELSVDATPVDITFLLQVGRISDSSAIAQRWREADPLSLQASTAWQLVLMAAGRVADQDAEYQRSKGLEGNHLVSENLKDSSKLTGMASARPVLPDMINQLRIFAQDTPPGTMPSGSIDKKAALAILRAAVEHPGERTRVLMLNIAWMGIYFGDHELALAAYRLSFVHPHAGTMYMWFPFWSSLRSDPRFKDIARDLGFVDYWRKSGKWGDFCRPTTGDDFVCH